MRMKDSCTISRNERKKIRDGYKRTRDAMSESLVQELSLKISSNVLEWEPYRQAETIFFYYPLGKEVSLLYVMQDALRHGKRIAFPKTTGDAMDFYEITDLDLLKEGSFHVMEPESRGKKAVSCNPDLCFVPGIAFDHAGGRFGYGRGYYDRYFADPLRQAATTRIGCAYECQISENLPVSDWDVRMDYLLTEKGIVKRKDDEKQFQILSGEN